MKRGRGTFFAGRRRKVTRTEKKPQSSSSSFAGLPRRAAGKIRGILDGAARLMLNSCCCCFSSKGDNSYTSMNSSDTCNDGGDNSTNKYSSKNTNGCKNSNSSGNQGAPLLNLRGKGSAQAAPDPAATSASVAAVAALLDKSTSKNGYFYQGTFVQPKESLTEGERAFLSKIQSGGISDCSYEEAGRNALHVAAEEDEPEAAREAVRRAMEVLHQRETNLLNWN